MNGPTVGDATHELIHTRGCGLVAFRFALGTREACDGMPVNACDIRLLDGTTPIPHQMALCGNCGRSLGAMDFRAGWLKKM